MKASKMKKTEVLTELWQHLLSLQKGFAFSKQKKRVRFDNGESCYLDLEMYHVPIHSLVLVNVYNGRPAQTQIMQMQRLVEHYNQKEKHDYEGSAIGVVINKTKTECWVSYVGVTDEQKRIAERFLALDAFKGNGGDTNG